jgi:hypothetical protein
MLVGNAAMCMQDMQVAGKNKRLAQLGRCCFSLQALSQLLGAGAAPAAAAEVQQQVGVTHAGSMHSRREGRAASL